MEGAFLEIPIYYYARTAVGNLVVEKQNLVTTMNKDNGRDYSFNVTNNGKGNTGKITLALPDWMKSLTGVTMPGLNQNDTATVVLRLMPTPDMQLNVPVTGRLGINCENGTIKSAGPHGKEKLTTGSPTDMASIMAIGSPSYSDVMTRKALFAYSSKISLVGGHIRTES